MDNRIYGYARVSTREQNEDRQIEALKRFGVPEQQIIMDKASGKDTEREGYLYLKRQILRRGDTLVIKELDRLSRNKSDIKRELEHFKEMGVRVKILDLPTTLTDFPSEQLWVQEMINSILIPSEAVQKNKLLLFFSLPPNASKQNDELCNRLLKHIILYKTNKVAPNDNIQIGTTQGWNIKNINQAIFEAKNNYPNVLHHLLPQSIMHCEKPVEKFNAQKYENYTQNFQGFFMKTLALKVLYLLRITSFHSTFAYQCGEHFDLLPNIVPSKTISQELIVSILQNNGIQSGSLLTLGDNSRKFQEHIAESNDAMIVFLDSTSLDEEKKRRSSIASVENAILSRKKGNRFVAAIISDYAAQQISPELRCPLLLSDCILRLEPCLLRKYLHTMDSHFRNRN